MGPEKDDCYLTAELAKDPTFVAQADMCASTTAELMVRNSAPQCGHMSLGLLGLAAAAAATEHKITEDEWIALARGLYRYHRAHPHDSTLVADPNGVHVHPGQTRH